MVDQPSILQPAADSLSIPSSVSPTFLPLFCTEVATSLSFSSPIYVNSSRQFPSTLPFLSGATAAAVPLCSTRVHQIINLLYGEALHTVHFTRWSFAQWYILTIATVFALHSLESLCQYLQYVSSFISTLSSISLVISSEFHPTVS